MNGTDLKYLKMTIDLAKKGEGKTSPNPLVGTVIAKNSRIIARGFHSRCGAAHAEINALKKARKKAKGATLYVNLEPCSHFGRTPPCINAIIKSGIKRVVVGMKDPNPVKQDDHSLDSLRYVLVSIARKRHEKLKPKSPDSTESPRAEETIDQRLKRLKRARQKRIENW